MIDLDVLTEINRLRDIGLSWPRVAGALNDLGVAGPYGGKWDHNNIVKHLRRCNVELRDRTAIHVRPRGRICPTCGTQSDPNAIVGLAPYCSAHCRPTFTRKASAR